jgi:hypothetical protein
VGGIVRGQYDIVAVVIGWNWRVSLVKNIPKVGDSLFMYPAVGCLREIFVIPTVCYLMRLNVLN